MKPYIDCPQDQIIISDYGYWLMPVGRVLSLTEGMSHGATVIDYIKGTLDERAFDEALKYERAQQPDVKASTAADFYAVKNMKWLRISISVYSGEFNVSWRAKPTQPILQNLSYLLHEHDQYNEDLYCDYGHVRGWTGLKKKLENSDYWR